ncbi:MAG: hypothetical protein FWC64_13300 [Treponema sp.]|nr:hypothetical protein [Treponema sp.]
MSLVLDTQNHESAAPPAFQPTGVEFVQVRAKKFRFDTDSPDWIFAELANNDNSLFRGDKAHAADIEDGYVYMFIDISSLTRGTELYVKRQRIAEAGDIILVPQRINNTNWPAHFAYSKIELDKERIAAIGRTIVKNRPTIRAAIRTQYISTQEYIAGANPPDTHRTPEYLDADGTIYLYDWFEYLEKCAGDYFDMVEKGRDGYERYLDEEVALPGGGAANGSGLSRRELYSFTDTIDSLVRESEKRSRRNWFAASLREDLSRPADGSAHDMYKFYDEARGEIDKLRSGGQAEKLNRTILLIGFLLADGRANSTFLDYMFGSQEQGRKVIALISKCLSRWQETLHKEEKERLFRAWQSPAVSASDRKIPPLAKELGGNGAATGLQVHGHIGEASVFLYMAAGVGASRGGALEDEAWDIIGIWFSVELTNRSRLIIHSLMVAGLFNGRREARLENAVLIRGGGRAPSEFFVFGLRAARSLDSLDGLEVIRIPKIVAEKMGALLELHHFLVEMQMAAQILDEGHAGWAIPHFISAAQSAALVRGIKNGFFAGVAVGAIFSALRAVVNVGLSAQRSGDIRVQLAYAASGASYVAAAATAQKVAAAQAAKIALKGGPALKWAAVGFTALAMAFEQFADGRARDRARLVVRHSLWGAENGDMPGRNERALLGRWWPELYEGDDEEKELEEELLAIVFSNAPTDAQEWHRRLMRLKAENADGEIRIRETLLRNAYLLNLVTQFPPIAVDAEANNERLLFNNFMPNYPIRVSGLQNFTLIESVSVKLKIASTGEYIKLSTGTNAEETEELIYTHNEGGNLLSLFLRAGSQNIGDRLDTLWAERLLLWFVARPQPLAAPLPNIVSSNPRFILFSDSPGQNIPKKAEILISYEDGSLLPVRIEQEFNWSPFRRR